MLVYHKIRIFSFFFTNIWVPIFEKKKKPLYILVTQVSRYKIATQPFMKRVKATSKMNSLLHDTQQFFKT